MKISNSAPGLKPIALACLLAALSTASAKEPGAVALDETVVSGFIESHCVSCHGPEKQKGKLHPLNPGRTDAPIRTP